MPGDKIFEFIRFCFTLGLKQTMRDDCRSAVAPSTENPRKSLIPGSVDEKWVSRKSFSLSLAIFIKKKKKNKLPLMSLSRFVSQTLLKGQFFKG